MTANRGYTLVELLIVLAIAGILLSIGLPKLATVQQAALGDRVLKTLMGHMALARSEAAKEGRIVTLCPSVDGVSCGDNWSRGSLLFSDRNADRKLNQDDRVIAIRQGDLPHGSLSWRAFGNRRYLQFTPTGALRYQSGNFTYCDSTLNPQLSRQLIVNGAGRVRVARDSNGDGIREDSNDKPIDCS